MSMVDITIVRVYLADGRSDLNQVEKWLRNEGNVRGYTVFRGIAGMGSDGKEHTASLLDLSSELPIVIEFFDKPERIDNILENLQKIVKADRIVSWSAKSGS
jgi:PII-like signaling protein